MIKDGFFLRTFRTALTHAFALCIRWSSMSHKMRSPSNSSKQVSLLEAVVAGVYLAGEVPELAVPGQTVAGGV